MKTSTILLLTTYVLLLATATHAQTIRRVNNNAGVTGVNVYTTAQAAHDAAAANDILMIEPSVTTYGDLTLAKPLKIYGNGYFLSTNNELKADQRNSTLNLVYFNTGSGGSSIHGIVVSGATIIYGVSNITIQRCNLGATYIYNVNVAATTTSNVSNILISQNFYNSVLGIGITSGYTISNVIITNNFLWYFNAIDLGVNNWIVRNNTFLNISNVTAASSLVNSVFENNLIPVPPTNGFSFAFTNVTFTNNVSYTTHFGTSNGNQANFTVTPELIGAGAGISTDEAFQIKAGSPLKTAGSGGTEVGAFGGLTPYVVSGIPAIPSIVNMSSTATGSNAVPLNVTISVKSNN